MSEGFALWHSYSLEILLLIDGQKQFKGCEEIRLCLESFCAGSLHTGNSHLTRSSVSSVIREMGEIIISPQVVTPDRACEPAL